MKVRASDRGFLSVHHPVYPPTSQEDDLVVTQSSIVGDYPDAMERPGTSALWFGFHHHLNREEVAQLVKHLQAWLDTGSLKLP